MPGIGGPPLRPLVVIVEDDAAVGELHRVELEASGFRVAVYNDGSALFASLDVDIPDAIVLDWQLAGLLTGAEIFKNLRLDERTGDLPVFFLSNEGSQITEKDGPIAWLLKSRTTPADLAARLRLALRSYGPNAPELGPQPT